MTVLRGPSQDHAAAGDAANPPAGQIRAWLSSRGWTHGEPGPGGCLWTPPDGGHDVAVPHGDKDQVCIDGAIKRIAGRADLPVDEVRRQMLRAGQPASAAGPGSGAEREPRIEAWRAEYGIGPATEDLRRWITRQVESQLPEGTPERAATAAAAANTIMAGLRPQLDLSVAAAGLSLARWITGECPAGTEPVTA